MKDKSEVEVVDLVLKLREKLVRSLLVLSSPPTCQARSMSTPYYHCLSRYGHRATSSL